MSQQKYKATADLPTTLPVFPLGGALLLPRGRLPLNIFEPRYLAMVDAALASHRLIGMVQPLDAEQSQAAPHLQNVGCAGRITSFAETDDGRYVITLTGVARFEIEEELTVMTPYRQVRAGFIGYEDDLDVAADGDDINRTRLVELLRQYLDNNNMEADWDSINSTGGEALLNSLCMISPFGIGEKQALLEAHSCVERADLLIAMIEMVMAGDFPGNPQKPMH